MKKPFPFKTKRGPVPVIVALPMALLVPVLFPPVAVLFFVTLTARFCWSACWDLLLWTVVANDRKETP